ARPGETILVPLGRGEKARMASGADQMYTVQTGDSLWGLARRFNMELADLQHMNGLKAKEEIKPGQKLVVASVNRQPAQAHAARVVLKTPLAPHQAQAVVLKTKSRGANHYTVKKGDTLWNVAQRFSTTVTQIALANRIKTNEALKPGQILVIASQ
ncbi:MAG: LysM peptidoglycan-binding domain-containing protein, partial [Halothiobacillus sp.]